jgi:hypothetical protein
MNGTPVKVTIVTPRRRRNRGTDLKRHVPKTLLPFLEDAFHDSDGYWFYFKADRVCGGACETGIVHEDTIREAKAVMRDMKVA